MTFDDRIVQVDIAFPSGTKTYKSVGSNGSSIYATGQKFDAAIMNQCDIRIYNLTPEERNFIISQTSPFLNPRTIIPITLSAGRVSYGSFILYNGYIGLSGTTQPPDIGVTLTALVNFTLAGVTTSNTQPGIASLSTICANVAAQNNLLLNFVATDKQISNYNYNGSVAYQVNALNTVGGIVASIDAGVLTVKNKGQSIGEAIEVSAATGMVGIPTFTYNGIRVTMMINNQVNLNSLIRIESAQLPAANGNYVVQKILFELASRDNPFFYTIEAINASWATSTGAIG
jgi:hypothetical protein